MDIQSVQKLSSPERQTHTIRRRGAYVQYDRVFANDVPDEVRHSIYHVGVNLINIHDFRRAVLLVPIVLIALLFYGGSITGTETVGFLPIKSATGWGSKWQQDTQSQEDIMKDVVRVRVLRELLHERYKVEWVIASSSPTSVLWLCSSRA